MTRASSSSLRKDQMKWWFSLAGVIRPIKHGTELDPILPQDDADNCENHVVYASISNGDAGDAKERQGNENITFSSPFLSSWKETLFPSNIPEELQLHRLDNIGVVTCYLLVGTCAGLFRPLLNVYPLELGATEAQQTTLSVITNFPATFKILFGFCSDNCPVAGYRRKFYMAGGWLLTSLIMAALMQSSDLSMSYLNSNSKRNDDLSHRTPVPPEKSPSIKWLCLAFFTFGFGMWFADVMADSLVVQKARLEPASRQGSLQSTCYATRFFGMMVAAPVSTALYGSFGPASIVWLLTLLPLIMIPLAYMLQEEKNYPIQSVASQCMEIWNTVQTRRVWQPMAFVYLLNMFANVKNAAWRQFLSTTMHLTASQLNLLLVASYVLLYVGSVTYKFCFLQSSWRRAFQATLLLNALLSAIQLLLIRGFTFGLSPFLFMLGDDAFAEFIEGFQLLPLTMMMLHLCPVGSEGVSFAMFTTFSNVGVLLGPGISTLLLGIWDVSKSALAARELDGLFRLTVLTTAIQLLPLLIVGWMPHGRKELDALAKLPNSKSAILGAVFLIVLFLSLAGTITVSILNVLKPGWAGGS